MADELVDVVEDAAVVPADGEGEGADEHDVVEVLVVAGLDAAADAADAVGEALRAGEGDALVAAAAEQEHGGLVVVDEVDGLGEGVLRRWAEELFEERVVGHGEEGVGPGEADEAGDAAGVSPGGEEVALVDGDHGGEVGAGGVAHDEELIGVAAEVGGVAVGPDDGGGGVLDEGGEADLGVAAVVGEDGDEASGGQGVGDEAVGLLAGIALAPVAAVEEDDDGAGVAGRSGVAGAAGGVDVELLAVFGAVGDVGDAVVGSEGGDAVGGLQRHHAGRVATAEEADREDAIEQPPDHEASAP